MGLTARLRRWAFARPHLFVVQGPGGTPARLATEHFARTHGWPLAATPADTDVIVACGQLPAGLRPLLRKTVAHTPLPRAVVVVADEPPTVDLPTPFLTGSVDELERLLEQARLTLGDWTAQRRLVVPDDDGGGQGHDDGDDMAPGGLAMPGSGDDRDGLSLEVLSVPLGPLLPAWPAGLRLRCLLQGDVVQHAEADGDTFAAATARPFWDAPWRAALAGQVVTVRAAECRRAAAHLDSLARLFAVAGSDATARSAARVRDAVLATGDPEVVRDGAASLLRRVGSDRLLARQCADLGVLSRERAEATGVSGPAARAAGVSDDARPGRHGHAPVAADTTGDVLARLRQWLAETSLALRLAEGDGALGTADHQEGPRGRLGGDVGPSAPLVRALPDLVRGQELSAARLIVASLDPDVDDLHAPAVVREPSHA